MNGLRQQLVMQQQNKKPLLTGWGRIEVTELGKEQNMGNIDNKRRPMLRNKNINYSRGMFFVTMQAAFNKTIFGAIVGEKCVLNELGEAVAASLQSLGERYAGVEIDEFVVMPNHVHFIIKVGVTGAESTPHSAALGARYARGICHSNHNLAYVVGRFKSWMISGTSS